MSNQFDDDYATCKKCYVSLLIYPNDYSILDITQGMNIQPKQSFQKGDIRITSRGIKKTHQNSLWLLSSEDFVNSLDIRRHLGWLLNELKPSKNYLLHLQKDEKIQMYVKGIWWSKFGDGGPMIWPEHMALLAEMNLELGFEISFFGEDK
ncbi:DUF4279 domain-containing protein [Bartonella sp. HY038]|uniref:DUF4279 domain-containing protein n=1 Tax=Bartonella sp. HY038 TaxID=2759660 RepID=UPI0015FE0B12|nr:DUF4279 domain-containing protein [Bartonella sp. HY038]